MWKLSRRPPDTADGLRFLLLISLAVVHAPYWSGEFNYQIGLIVLTYYFGVHGETAARVFVADIMYSVVLFLCHALMSGEILYLHRVALPAATEDRAGRGERASGARIGGLVRHFGPAHDYDPGKPLTVGPG